MKKWVSLLLAGAMLFGLCACGSPQAPVSTESTQPENTVLMAGYGRESILPEEPVGMMGYGDIETRLTGAVLDPIYTTCVAFQEGDQTFLVYTVDVCAIGDASAQKIREYVNTFMDIPGENIFIGATHTHSAPQIGLSTAWDNLLSRACLNAAMDATEDLAAVQLEAATTTLENMNFVRHYLMNDGTYYGSNFGSTKSGYKAHALEYADRQLILLKLNREAKQDILMINWQAHPAAAARQDDYTGVSADFIGHTRNVLETETDMLIAYYTGAAGNTNPSSLILEENTNNNNSYKEYGKTLARMILDLLPQLKSVEGTGLQTTRLSFEAEVDHSWDHMIDQANEVYDVWKTEGQSAGTKLGKEYGFTSVYQASAVRRRYAWPATQTRDLRVLRVGSIGFTSGTYEMFSDHAQYVKENSPFDITFVITGCDGYITNKAAFAYRSYESDCGAYASGTGEKMAEEYVKLLNAVK